jgi:hypothetical protein
MRGFPRIRLCEYAAGDGEEERQQCHNYDYATHNGSFNFCAWLKQCLLNARIF